MCSLLRMLGAPSRGGSINSRLFGSPERRLLNGRTEGGNAWKRGLVTLSKVFGDTFQEPFLERDFVRGQSRVKVTFKRWINVNNESA